RRADQLEPGHQQLAPGHAAAERQRLPGRPGGHVCDPDCEPHGDPGRLRHARGQVSGELTYVGAAPQSPRTTLVLTRGSLNGRVLVAEAYGVRQVQFQPGGGATDLGLTSLGTTNDVLVGSMGVQP